MEKIPENYISKSGITRAKQAVDSTASAGAGSAGNAKSILSHFKIKTYPSAPALFSDKEKGTLLSMPSKDLFLILNWVDDSRLKQLFSFIYEWVKEQNKDLNLSDIEFYGQIKNAPQNEILDTVEAFINFSNVGTDGFKKEIKEKISIAASQDFKNEYNWFTSNLNAEKTGTPHYEIFTIFTKTDFNKNRYLSAMRTKEFKDFCLMIKENYDIAASEINYLLDLYLNPETLYYLKSDNTAAAFKILKKHFKTLNFDSMDYALAPESIIPSADKDKIKLSALVKSGEFEKKIAEKADAYKMLEDSYGFKIKNPWGLKEFLRNNNDKIMSISNPAAALNWDYLKTKYPGKPDLYKVSLSCLDGFYEINEKLCRLETTAARMDEFLNLFNTDLGKIGIPYLGDIGGDTIKYLTKNAGFKEYLNAVFAKYPALLKDTEKNIKELASNYFGMGPYSFLTLNELLEKFDGFEKPEVHLDNAEEKKEILAYILKNNLNKIFISYDKQAVFSHDDSKEKLDLCVGKMKDGAAKKLYDALINDWKLEKIELDKFLWLLESDNGSFYTDKENAEKFIILEKKYNIRKIENDIPSKIKTPGGISFSSLKKLIENFDFYNNDAVADSIFRYFPDYFKTGIAGKGISVSNLARMGKYKIFLQYKVYAQTLKNNCGFSDNDIEELLYMPEETVEKILNAASDEKTLGIFRQLTGFYKEQGGKTGNRNILLMAIEIKNKPNAMKILKILQELGSDMSLTGNFVYANKTILTQDAVTKNLLNKDFIVFYKKTIKYFYNGKDTMDMIPEISELYDKIAADENIAGARRAVPLQELLFSDKYLNTISYIRTKFNITNPEPSTLLPLLEIADGFDEARMNLLIEGMEKQADMITANDLYMLTKILKDPGLKELLFDRQKMIAELQSVLKLPAAPREKLDRAAYLEADLQLPVSAEKKEEIKSEIGKIKNAYTERPALEKLSSLQLLRLYLLKEALEDKSFLKNAGRLALDDRLDKTTEHGGTVTLNKNGTLQIKDIKSASEFDGEYISAKYPYLNCGAFSFHMHALEGSEKYSGPSGWLGARGGDIAAAEHFGLTDMLVTVMKQDDKSVTLNFDLYWVDKRDSENPQVFIFDMGTRTVEK